MKRTQAQLRKLILDDKSVGELPKPDPETGRYDSGGTEFPKSGVGQGAVIFLENENGGYDVLCSRRSMRMEVHPGQWGILGGYLTANKGEGPLEAIWREIREETKGLVNIDGLVPYRVIPPYMDYNDKFNKSTMVVQHMFILRGKKARETRAAILKANAAGNFDSEVMGFDFMPIDDRLDERIAEKGGFGYPQSTRALRIAAHYLPKRRAKRPGPRPRQAAETTPGS